MDRADLFGFNRAMMRWLLCFLFVVISVRADDTPPIVSTYTKPASQLIDAATNSNFAFQRLAYLCDTFGPRFSGSTNLDLAIDWILAEMKKDGLQNVRGEEVTVPHWVRGNESLEMVEPRHQKLSMLGIGMSIGTPAEGITGEVRVIDSFDAVASAKDVKGKIVLINEPFTSYSETVKIRTRGAVQAAKAGAVACLVRSVTPMSLQTPHTGNMRYSNDIAQIPAAAVTVETAEMFKRMQERGQKVVIRLKMEAKMLPDVKSRNVIGEIVGSEKPEEIVVVSGHIDSWDVGQGAMDDGGGCVAAWEAVRLMHKLGLRPKRTVRVVLWANEENGIRGARGYRDQHKNELAKHVLAIESDQGPFKPSGFSFRGSDKAAGYALQVGEILNSIDSGRIKLGAEDADVYQLATEGIPIMDLVVDGSKYFWYHHTEADTIDKLNASDLGHCTAAMAVMSYIIADMPEKLPRKTRTAIL